MKISDIIIIIIIILIIVLIIYSYLKNKKGGNQNSKLQNLKVNKLNNKLNKVNEPKKSEEETYKDVEKLLIYVINTRFNYSHRLNKEEEELLYPNYKSTADRIIDRGLKFYNIYELKEISSKDPFDFVASIPNIDKQYDRIVTGLQLNSIKYLLNKFPKVEPHIIIKYIKNYKNIFPMGPAVYKNKKIYFTKEQQKILDNFGNYLER